MGLVSSLLSAYVLVFGANDAPNSNINKDEHKSANEAVIVEKVTANDQVGDVWDITRQNLTLTKSYSKARVVKEIKRFNRNPYHMKKVSKQAAPYFHYVMQEVIKRGFPAEVALLPVVESLYNPNAYSSGKASGIWQFIPSTAKYFGIEISPWYDGRRDVITSTGKALDYLAKLNKRFGGDWMLTFAAYNAGEGRVSRAIRKNRKQELATDYWSLALPEETRHYVPRILAIGAIVQNPEQYKVNIPKIANTPYFEEVSLQGQIDLTKVAQLLNIEKSLVLKLNPGFKRNISAHQTESTLLVPVDKVQMIAMAEASAYKPDSYIIKAGDSLSVIAEQFGLSVKSLKKANSLFSSTIHAGKKLYIPTV